MSLQLSIVIPTWNHKELLVACLESLEAQTFQDFEVVVVDDGSTDGTATLLEMEYPTVRLVRLPKNRGFCAATNAGVPHARADLVMLLNNDMTLDSECLAHLVAAAAFDDADLFAPLVLFRDDPAVIYGAGDRQRVDGRPESIGFRQPLAGFAFPEAIFGVSAGAGLYRRAVFDRVGLLDERFIAYFEDSDLSFRARLAGFRTAFVRDAVLYHAGAASIAGRTWWRARQCYRNHLLLVVKNMPTSVVRANLAAILRERWCQLRSAFSAIRTQRGALRAAFEIALTDLAILRQLPHAFAERRRIQHDRVIADEDLAALLSPSDDSNT